MISVKLRTITGPYGIDRDYFVFIGGNGNNVFVPITRHEYSIEDIDSLEREIIKSYGILWPYEQDY